MPGSVSAEVRVLFNLVETATLPLRLRGPKALFCPLCCSFGCNYIQIIFRTRMLRSSSSSTDPRHVLFCWWLTGAHEDYEGSDRDHHRGVPCTSGSKGAVHYDREQVKCLADFISDWTKILPDLAWSAHRIFLTWPNIDESYAGWQTGYVPREVIPSRTCLWGLNRNGVQNRSHLRFNDNERFGSRAVVS